MLNALSAVWLSASVARNVKLYVVSLVAAGAVPVIAPVDELSVKFIVLAGVFELLVKTLVVSLNATVESDEAPTSKDTDAPAATSPRLPADVLHVGASDTVSIADELRAARPSGFSTLIKYVPSVGKVALTVSCVAESLVMLFGKVITPDELINSTCGVITKFVPAITRLAAVLPVAEGVTPVTVGYVAVAAATKLNTPEPSVFSICPAEPSAVGILNSTPLLLIILEI